MKIHSLSQDIFQEMIDPQILEQSPEKISEILGYLSKKIAGVMHADVCSLYLFNPETKTLTLKATHGLNAELIDKLTFKVGVGLTGMTLKLLKPITVSNVEKNKMFLPIPNLGEEEYKSFLSIPLVYSQKPIGVMVVQNRKPTTYRKKDIQLLLSLSIPAVSLIERAKFVGTMERLTKPAPAEGASKRTTKVEYLTDHTIHGIAAAPGISVGTLRIVEKIEDTPAHQSLESDGVTQKALFQRALTWVKDDVAQTREKAAQKFGPEEVGIFEAYSLLLESDDFSKQITDKIDDGSNVIEAINAVVSKYTDRITHSEDEYIRERAYDIQDIAQKIIDRILYGEKQVDEHTFDVEEDTIFLNRQWSISDLPLLDPKKVRGILSDRGGASSHVSLLADAAGIPAVFGLGNAVFKLNDGDRIIIDGHSGAVIINPSDETLASYKREMIQLEKQKRFFEKDRNKKIILKRDDSRQAFPIGANIELIPHAQLSLQSGADEIGLYRTEFPFLTADRLPTEEEQYQNYRNVLKLMKGKEVTFRTLDIGGDKYVSYLDLPEENNPFLGWRSIRFSLERKDLFRIQLRALLKASVFGKMRLLFPMVTTMEQVEEIENSLETVQRELYDEGLKLPGRLPKGFMIEVPASVEIADHLAKHADFLSIGTNDLIQYGLAVDRTNPLVAHLYDPYHPAILKMMQKTIRAAHKADIKVSVCGETAAQPDLAAVLISLGADSLSMNPQAIPRIKHFVRQIDWEDVKPLAQKVLRQSSGQKIKDLLFKTFQDLGWEDYLDYGADQQESSDD